MDQIRIALDAAGVPADADPLAMAGVAVAVIAVGLVLRFLIRSFIVDWKLSSVPRPPGALPFLGHALELAKGAPWKRMAKWCAEHGNGKLLTFNVAGQRVVYVAEPSLLKRILQTQQRHYRKDIAMSYQQFLCILGTGLVTSEGEKWRKGRLLLSHALRIDMLEEVPAMTVPLIHQLAEKINKGTEPIDLCEEYRHLTLQVIGQAALSFSPELCDEIFPALYLPIVTECNAQVWSPWRQYMPFLEGYRRQKTCLSRLDAVLSKTIRERWAERQKNGNAAPTHRSEDILDRCMSQLQSIDDAIVKQLRDDCKTMLLAGHETSAALLTWATAELIANPEYAAKVAAEAREHLGEFLEDPSKIPPLSAVRKLEWTPAVLRETLRRHSVVPLVMRTRDTPDVFPAAETGLKHDVTIPAGVTIAVGIEGVHNRPDIHKNPHDFKPDRMMPGVFETIDPFAFIPFINGPRNCLGQHLSLVETQLVLAYMTSKFVFESKMPISEAMVPHTYEVPVVPNHGLEVTASKR